MRIIKYSFLIITLLSVALTSNAKENISDKGGSTQNPNTKTKLLNKAANCEPATASADLDVNNVRTKILNGGDMWWNLANPRYEVPRISDQNAVRKHSLFSGAIWIGGLDGGGNIKMAAMTYRQRGSDFYPGPLDRSTGNTSEALCKQYDVIYKITRVELEKYIKDLIAGTPAPTEGIATWPGDKVAGEGMAPFADVDGDMIYDPLKGDYPVLQNECRGVKLTKDQNLPEKQPDQMLYFVYNDKGGQHSETFSAAIGLELHTTAFAYATNDEINNMTFYKTRVINRGSTALSNTYFGEWVDADLGNYRDDYVGCDVKRSLGFCYNGDDNDEGILGYGLNPPTVGIDFFEGPKKDTIINGVATKVELGMSKFVYYNNTSDPVNGNPDVTAHFYNYLQGKWKNGKCITRDGKNGLTGTACTNYMFPFDTDTTFSGNWNERSAGNEPNDRRFLQTAGPFTLQPGAINFVTVGVVWARASSGGAEGSLTQLKLASDKAQELFNNCFTLVDGPDAPVIEVQELDKKLILMMGKTKTIEAYSDTLIDKNGKINIYKFQGYRLYQLKDGTVGTGDLEDVDKAREIFSCDIKDNIIRLVNQPFDPTLGQRVPKLMIDGNNKGLVHSLEIVNDVFATGSNKSLVNFKDYYYMMISYAALPGHPELEYLAGRRIVRFVNSPRNPQPRFGGSKLNGDYGSTPEITRIEGSGNGGNFLNLTIESENEILKSNKMANPTYAVGGGPVKISVLDPLKVTNSNYEFVLRETFSTPTPPAKRDSMKPANTSWWLIKLNDLSNANDNDTVFSEYNIITPNQQIITENTGAVSVTRTSSGKVTKAADWGLAVDIGQVFDPGANPNDEKNGLIGAEVIFSGNSGSEWLSAIRDSDGGLMYNWIRAGNEGKGSSPAFNNPSTNDWNIGGTPIDEFGNYEKLWEGRIAPYRLASRYISSTSNTIPQNLIQGFAFDGSPINSQWSLKDLAGVEFVITPDRSKWTRCIVFEMTDDPSATNNIKKFYMRDAASLDKYGNKDASEKGRSWFPGYAINVETGERLNIAFGEDSKQKINNGNDMKWNPTSDASFQNGSYAMMGGRHFVYVFGSYEPTIPSSFYPKLPIYDEGTAYKDILATVPTMAENLRNNAINKVMYQCMWVIPTLLSDGFEMKEVDGMPVPLTEVRFKIRVNKPYKSYNTLGFTGTQSNSLNYDNPKYTFNTKAIFNDIQTSNGTDALDMINVVPNPYYAFSNYENNPVENKVKFTNLPKRADISIYTLDGNLVRQIKKDDQSTDVIWDLKNNAKVPIASGIYIVHVNAPGLGEKVFKFMGVMRELDLDSF